MRNLGNNYINKIKIVVICLCMIHTTGTMQAQVIDTSQNKTIPTNIPNEESEIDTPKQDIIQPENSDIIETTPPKDNGYGVFSVFDGNPGRAALFSFVVPGLGQAYNKKWWKVPIAIGAEVITVSILVNNIREWRASDNLLRAVLRGERPLPPNTTLTTLGTIRSNARQNRDITWVALFGVHIIIAADAFVDRHLIEFDVSDDLSIKASPFTPYPGMNIVMTF